MNCGHNPTVIEKVLIKRGWNWQQFVDRVSRDEDWFYLARQMCQEGELHGLRHAYINHLGGEKAKRRFLDSIK
jgi:hypothetical protein